MEIHSKHLPADERRAVTVRAVVELAASQTPSESTTAATANHMNLTQGAVFRQVLTKEAIWEAIMDRIDRSAQEAESPLDVERIRCDAPRAFAIYRHGVGSAQ